jgi:hypothetical protein
MATRYNLPAWHVAALEWFEANAGREFDQRPFEVGLPTKVTSLQKGIWKPAATQYALSVVQTHKGVYDDLDPIRDPADGTWTYYYHQQGKTEEDLRDPTRHYANVALMRCAADGVPVGVIIPAESGRGYEVLGLAFVERDGTLGYFKLVGPVSIGAPVAPFAAAETRGGVSAALIGLPMGEFDPHAVQDNRLKVIAEVHRRQGGPRFRRALLQAYQSRCAMTEYDAEAALEAAHIIPYQGPQTNHPTNGLLLRADMHDLFDLGLIAVDTDKMRLRLSSELEGTKYEPYEGKLLLLPRDYAARPSVEALDMHRAQSSVA